MAVPKRKTPRAKTRQRRASNWRLAAPAALDLPQLWRGQAAPHRVRQLRLVRRPPGDRRRVALPVPITVAVDAMGGDRAPAEIVAGAVQAAEELGVRVLLVGDRRAVAPLLPARHDRCGAGADHRGRRDARPAGVGAHEEGLVDRA